MFCCICRHALEAEEVSAKLHHWIDLTFGHKLTGHAAMLAKNVTLPPRKGDLRSTGRPQLFQRPHPMRRIKSPAASYQPQDFVSALDALEVTGDPKGML